MLWGLHAEYTRRPSTAAFMLRGFLRSGLRRAVLFPPIRARWRGHRVERARLAEFLGLTGLDCREGLPLLHPHVFGFPLQMVILTHPAFPLPIWRVLQVRNHLLQHRPIPLDSVLDLETSVADQRILEKGVEVDLHTTVHSSERLCWESLNTFYYRGRFGEATAASPPMRGPEVDDRVVARWTTPPGGGWRFAGLTGDYNPIHWWSPYARLFGFRGAFHHPQLILGQALARLAPAGSSLPRRLDAWLKGPVYTGGQVTLRASPEVDGSAFALVADGEQRPAILGRWRAVPPGSRLRT
jgi:acyl dehydratase